mgnify:CR=1 FL=1
MSRRLFAHFPEIGSRVFSFEQFFRLFYRFNGYLSHITHNYHCASKYLKFLLPLLLLSSVAFAGPFNLNVWHPAGTFPEKGVNI